VSTPPSLETTQIADPAPQHTPAPTHAPGRIEALDGLRGIAVLSVMAFHFWAISGPHGHGAANRLVAKIFGGGWAGVDLFFVLSGFLITGILCDARGRARYFRTFYARRVLRIFPLYFALLAVLFIVLPLVLRLDTAESRDLGRHQLWFWTYLVNWWIATRHGMYVDLLGTGHLWTLSMEEQFYIVWPAVVLLVPRRALLAACAATIVAACGVRIAMHANDANALVIYTFTFARADALAAGALVAVAMRDDALRPLLRRWAAPACGAAALVLLAVIASSGALDPLDATVQLAGLSALALGFAALVAVVVTGAAASLGGILSLGALRATGRYSYALYVVHWPIATWLARHTDLSSTTGGPRMLDKAIFALVAAVIAFAAAIASWHLLESPILRLKDRFPYR